MKSLQARFRISLIIFIGVLLLSVVGFMATEGLSLVDAIYFSIATLATVGYGDIHPVTLTGKLLAIFVIVMGVGTFLGVIANGTEIMLTKRETQARLEKLNMIVGVFFSGVGTRLLADFSNFDPELEHIRKNLIVTNEWSDQDFSRVSKGLQKYAYAIEIHRFDLPNLKVFLVGQRDFLLRLLENPNLLEHETFTELLLAVFHLIEELVCREELMGLPESDISHLKGDIRRAYSLLVKEWLHYMKHLKRQYPYLFSLALRTNPFDQGASPIVK
jgi:voltage-gated potassium channel